MFTILYSCELHLAMKSFEIISWRDLDLVTQKEICPYEFTANKWDNLNEMTRTGLRVYRAWSPIGS